jgi:hypothetical protein
MEVFFYWVFGVVVFFGVLFIIVRSAVAEGTLDALKEYDRIKKEEQQ